MAPIYDYKALGANGKAQKGIVEAENQKAARAKLKKQGLMITEVVEKSSLRQERPSSLSFLGGGIKGAEVAAMTRQLSSLVKANIPLVEALGALVDQTENEKLKVILSQVRQDVNEGSSLAKATGSHPKVFDTIFVNMIEAGESSGTLSLVLIRLADLKEAQMRLRNKVIGAMTYPLIMMSVSFILMMIIFTFVIPKLTGIFVSLNKPIPGTTLFMMNLSGSLIDYWYLWLSVIGFIAWSFKKYTNSEKGRPKWDAFKLRLPVAGKLVRMVAVTRFSSTMATLLDSGVPILTSMNIARNLVGNVPIANAITIARENITEGQSIADPLRRSGEFPPMMTHMIAIGEKTGELPEMLNSIAETYEEQVNTQIDALTSLIEPLMILGMGLSVGVVVLSVFSPMMEMMNLTQR